MIIGAAEFFRSASPLRRALTGICSASGLLTCGLVLTYVFSTGGARTTPSSLNGWMGWLLASVFVEFVLMGAIYSLLMLVWCILRPRIIESFLLWSARSIGKLFFLACFIIAAVAVVAAIKKAT